MIIELLNGTRLDIENYDLKRLFHRIPSPTINHTTTTVEGRGDIITSSTLGNRVIEVEFGFRVADIHDYYLLRDEMNALFVRNEPFYIIFKRESYKRWKVRLNNQFAIEPTKRLQSFTVEFITENRFAESIASSLQLQNAKEWDLDLYAWGMGLYWDDEPNYTFTTRNFVVNNYGNATVNPGESFLDITLRGVFLDYIQIKNNSTNETYRYNRRLTRNDELKISGVRTLRNGVSDFKNTNKNFISLKPGENSFTIEGGTLVSINFDFKFLYL